MISYHKFKTGIAIEYCDSWKGSVRLKLVVFIDMHHSEPWSRLETAFTDFKAQKY